MRLTIYVGGTLLDCKTHTNWHVTLWLTASCSTLIYSKWLDIRTRYIPVYMYLILKHGHWSSCDVRKRVTLGS